MNAERVDLQAGEQIIFDEGSVVLTNQRLLANWGGGTSDEAPLRDIESFQTNNGGQESRLALGVKAVAVGIGLILIETVATFLPDKVDIILFMLGACGIVVGLYFISVTPFQVSAHTSVRFKVPSATEIEVRFPGKNNPAADELTRRFVRAKRRL